MAQSDVFKTVAEEGHLDQPAPFYERVKSMIKTNVHSGVWPVNFRVPSESELVSQFGYSRMTINRALRELTAEGLLVRMQGVGTFVAEVRGQSALLEINNIADEIVSRGHRHHARVLELTQLHADAQQALAFNLPKGSRLFHSLICHYENGVPVMLEDRLVNALIVPDYLQQDFTRITPNAYLSSIAPIVEGEHIIEAVNVPRTECAYLEIDEHTPCLQVNRRTWTGRQDKKIVTSVRLVYPGPRYRLEGSMRK
ncbi:GntR family transcriptional regulator, histidine utilization repressor [Kosakonia oryzendophytica]|uniref:Histidine utilization repressor n=1 Tax=Kosakonia oryzendophytica TaxID=1005665 RepID=A0A1C4DUV2_9ENTR|nr:histidine utilization repressor [Kosakonia oryzendophytica]AMO47142.1 Transcriptional regulator, histidine utilization repressor, GntR family [Enterobacter sp. FY-07]TDT56728.1 GntR family histidine utilization transcriptional repressor [Enterobacter sp. AG5470]WBT58883.1 histidine utilization repressor [Kosakonia oryzendophytica]SCC35127.1 GntR family transcriptional regulator, histidine utilization repressor [Kosakonia oryzendophytica]